MKPGIFFLKLASTGHWWYCTLEAILSAVSLSQVDTSQLLTRQLICYIFPNGSVFVTFTYWKQNRLAAPT